MANTTVASHESLSDILNRFSIAISAIKVAKEALSSPRLDHSIVEDALTLAIDDIDDTYDLFDATLVRLGRDVPDLTLERIQTQCERISQVCEQLDDIAKQLDPAAITAPEVASG